MTNFNEKECVYYSAWSIVFCIILISKYKIYYVVARFELSNDTFIIF